ncbi:MAG TPA: hypothetical protein VNY36_04440 [Bacteroidia bacterium]|nr:hypothetical protein [Bacteroidia bacterium]
MKRKLVIAGSAMLLALSALAQSGTTKNSTNDKACCSTCTKTCGCDKSCCPNGKCDKSKCTHASCKSKDGCSK